MASLALSKSSKICLSALLKLINYYVLRRQFNLYKNASVKTTCCQSNMVVTF